MLDFHQKRKVRSFMYNRITLGALAVLILLVLHSTWVVYQKKKTSGQMKDISLKHLDELQSRSNELKSRIDRLVTTPGIEEEIRSKFSVVKDKENMVVVVEAKSSGISTTSPENNFWQKIWDFFSK